MALHGGAWAFTQNARFPGNGVLEKVDMEYIVDLSRRDVRYDRDTLTVGSSNIQDSQNRVTTDLLASPTLYYEFNFPDFFAAYNGYYVAINVAVDSHSNPAFFNETGWSMEVDVSQLLDHATVVSPYIRTMVGGGILRSYLLGKMKGQKLRVTVHTSIRTSELVEGCYAVYNFLINTVLYGQRLQVEGSPAGFGRGRSSSTSSAACSDSEWDILPDDV